MSAALALLALLSCADPGPWSPEAAVGAAGADPAALLQDLRQTDPSAFDRAPPRPPLDQARQAAPFSASVEQRDLYDMLRFLKAEALARDPSLALPPDEELRRACRPGRADDPGFVAELDQLKAAWAQVGLTWPAPAPAGVQ